MPTATTTLLRGTLILAVLTVARGAAADPSQAGAAQWQRRCQSCHVVVRAPIEPRRAEDGRTVLYQAILERNDAELFAYLTEKHKKRPKPCQVELLSRYDAPLLIAFLRAATKPEPKTHLPVIPAQSRARRGGGR